MGASFSEFLTIEHYMVKNSQFIVKIHIQTNFLNLMWLLTHISVFASLLTLHLS